MRKGILNFYYMTTLGLWRKREGECVLGEVGRGGEYWIQKKGSSVKQGLNLQDFTIKERTSYLDISSCFFYHSLSITIMFACERIHLIFGVFLRSLRSGSLEARHSYVPESSRVRLVRWIVLVACAIYVAFILTRSFCAPSNSWV